MRLEKRIESVTSTTNHNGHRALASETAATLGDLEPEMNQMTLQGVADKCVGSKHDGLGVWQRTISRAVLETLLRR